MREGSLVPFRRVFTMLVLAVMLGCDDMTGIDEAGYPLLAAPAVTLTDAQRLAYEEDAVRLAVRHLNATNSPLRLAVEPPAALTTSLYNGLVAVHGVSHPARDTVLELYRVRAFPNPPVYELAMRVDPAASWTEAWRNGTELTGDPAIDELVTRYGIVLAAYYQWSMDYEVALLRASRPLNTTALASRFAAVPGVFWAEPNGYMGDGADIRATPDGSGWRLGYSFGFGDCMAGCIDRVTWTFRVGRAGDVRYVGRSGPPPPAPPAPAAVW